MAVSQSDMKGEAQALPIGQLETIATQYPLER